MKKLAVLLVVSLIPVFVEAQQLKAGGPTPSWCSSRTNSYCTYAWNWMTRCCYPTYISPGAYCPQICE